MEIDELFDIQLTLALEGMPVSTRLLRPSSFFDMDFVASRGADEIRCTVPWRHDDPLDYLPAAVRSGGVRIQWLQIDIADRRNAESRRVTEQH